MIWIATLCLLALAAWLFFNALNERRWVDAHIHDESVAADPGIFPDFGQLGAKVEAATDGKFSMEKTSASLGRAATMARETTGKAGASIERRVAGARAGDYDDTVVGRAVAKIGAAIGAKPGGLDAHGRETTPRPGTPVTDDAAPSARPAADPTPASGKPDR